ncbi:MAG TPA: site-2 protease family protein, partial [Verrucomicrobiae bacterium]
MEQNDPAQPPKYGTAPPQRQEGIAPPPYPEAVLPNQPKASAEPPPYAGGHVPNEHLAGAGLEHSPGAPPVRTTGQKLKKALGPFGIILVVIAKFFAKVKFLLLPVFKFLPVILKTGGTMLLSIGVYAMAWGFWFAVGFVLLIFVHECGHLIAAKRLRLNVSAPMFIPFFGALITLREMPKNAWHEAQVGIGGPLLGALGAAVCEGIYLATGKPIFRGLAYTGFFLNLFNLAPIGFLDGGRIVTALSPWLWLVGLAVVLTMTIMRPNFILIIILI